MKSLSSFISTACIISLRSGIVVTQVIVCLFDMKNLFGDGVRSRKMKAAQNLQQSIRAKLQMKHCFYYNFKSCKFTRKKS